MRRFILAALAALVSVYLGATVPTTVVTYTVINPGGTFPATAPIAYAQVTYLSNPDPMTLKTMVSPSYAPTTGALTWTLPQNSQVKFVVASTGVNGTYTLGSSATYNLNTLIPASSPITAPPYMANYLLKAGDTMTGPFNLSPFTTALLPVGVEGRMVYDSTAKAVKAYQNGGWVALGAAPDLSGLVPYTGATGDVDSGTHLFKALGSGTPGQPNAYFSAANGFVASDGGANESRVTGPQVSTPKLTGITDTGTVANLHSANSDGLEGHAASYFQVAGSYAPASAGVPTPVNPADNAKVLTANAGTFGWAAPAAAGAVYPTPDGAGWWHSNGSASYSWSTPTAANVGALALGGGTLTGALSIGPLDGINMGLVNTSPRPNAQGWTLEHDYGGAPQGGSIYGNDVMRLGYNVTTGGGLVNASEPGLALELESFYSPAPGFDYMEGHLAFHKPTTGNAIRPFAFQVDRSTFAVNFGLNYTQLTMQDPAEANPWMYFSGHNIWFPDIATFHPTITNQENGFGWIQQFNNVGAAVPLIWIDTTNKINLGDGNAQTVLAYGTIWGVGEIKGDHFNSTVATGTAPLTVASTTPVTNLSIVGTAANATNTGITEDTTTSSAVYPTWVTANTGNLPQKTTSTRLSFVPSTGALSSTIFKGSSTTTGDLTVPSNGCALQGNGGYAILRAAAGLAVQDASGNYTQPVRAAGHITRGAFASEMNETSVTEDITLSTLGTTTDSSTNLLPANSVILGVTARIETTITTATDWKLGDGTIAGRFTAANSTLTAGTTDVGTLMTDQTGTSGPRQVSAAKLRITTTGTPGAGVIRVVVYYRQFTAPTS